MHINVNNSIQINYLDFELVNIIQDAKKETTYRIMYSHLGTQIHEVSKDTRLPLSHLLPTMSDTGSSQARTTRATVQG